ncbi:universal stress protein [Mycolicibacterium komossense]|nr:universal stress protein [Mycolicibacterium komossense]
MSFHDSMTPIVVGMDGSDAAMRAACWAVDEAISRDAPLRLVYIIEPGSEAVRLEIEYAGLALRAARAAVRALSCQVEIDTDIRRGGIDTVLAQESRHAAMICIGSADPDGEDDDHRPSTSTALARSALCPVAVIGAPDLRVDRSRGCVAVLVNGSRTDDLMLQDAFEEARLRHLPLLTVVVGSPAVPHRAASPVDQSVAERWHDHTDVPVHCVTVHTDVVAFLADIAPAVAVTFVNGTAPSAGGNLSGADLDAPVVHNAETGSVVAACAR